jgi:hypothetical protein
MLVEYYDVAVWIVEVLFIEILPEMTFGFSMRDAFYKRSSSHFLQHVGLELQALPSAKVAMLCDAHLITFNHL